MYTKIIQQPRLFRSSLFQLLLGACILQALSGCVSTSAIKVDDSSATTSSFRISTDATNRSEGQSAAVAHSSSAIEFGYARVKGSADQTLVGGAPIVLNGATFTGPTVHNTATMSYTDITWRGRKFFGHSRLGMEWTVGVAQTKLDLSVLSAPQQASRHYTANGVQGGIGFDWRLWPTATLHLRGTTYHSDSVAGLSAMWHSELFISQALSNNLALRLGYTKWSGDGKGLSLESDFNFNLSGPELELGLCF